MAFDGPATSIPGLVAGANLSGAGNQYRFVEVTAEQSVTRQDAAGAASIGVLYNTPASGEAADVRYGVVQIEAGAGVTAGQKITSDNEGRAIAATSTTTVHGIAITTVTTAGHYITAVVLPGVGEILS